MLMETAGKLLALSLLLGTAFHCSNGDSTKVVRACGVLQPIVSLICSHDDSQISVIQLQGINASRKETCPESATETACTVSLDSSNSMYNNVSSQCQGRLNCKVRIMQVTLPLNGCSSVWRNYIEIYYTCNSSGSVVPAFTTAESEEQVSTSPTDSSEEDAADGSHSTDGTSHSAAALIICMILLLIVIALVIVTVIFYRKEKLPKSLQRRIAGIVFEISLKVSHISARRNTTPNVYHKRSEANMERQKPAGMGEDVYCSIDEVESGPPTDCQYEDWNRGPTPASRHLPKVLAISPNRKISTSNHTSAEHTPAGYLSAAHLSAEHTSAHKPEERDFDDVDDDDEWNDSEFDQFSDEDGRGPTPPPYLPDACDETGTPQQYYVLEKDNSNRCTSHCSCEKTTCNVAMKATATPDEYTYCAPEMYRRSMEVAGNNEYDVPSQGNASAGHAPAIYDSAAVNDETYYYSTAATYKEDI